MATHVDKAFEKDLQSIRDGLSRMGATVEGRIADAMRSLSERDVKLARKVMDGDMAVNRLEVELDERCQNVLALRQPAASDLRLITAALKLVTDLERCGDLAVNIAERSAELAQAPPLSLNGDFARLAALALHQLHAAIDTFVHADPRRAEVVRSGDAQLDSLFVKLLEELLALMSADAGTIRRATSLLFIAKHLERIGDHATNIAELVIYMVKGTDVRHPRSRAR